MDKPVYNIVHGEKPPEDKKGILLAKDKRINEAKTLDEQIDAYIDFINVAITDIPLDSGYDRERWRHLEPSFSEAKAEYIRDVHVPYKAILYRDKDKIEYRRKTKFKRLLQLETGTVIEYLTKYKGWVFNKTGAASTLGK